jgi:hypothetical protein
MRKLLLVPALVIAWPVAWYAASLWANHRFVPTPDKAVLSSSLERAIVWLETDMKGARSYTDPYLWWMLKQSAETSRNQHLVTFYNSIEPLLLKNRSWHIWSSMFYPGAKVKLPPFRTLRFLPHYDYLYLYGLTCNTDWEREPEVQGQLHPDFCSLRFLHPYCTTRQLLGVRFMQRNGCGDPGRVAGLARELQDRIVTELDWDPRVTGAYIMRVLMLAESGVTNRVKPVWIQRILDAQHADGGWGDVDPVLPLPNGKVLGLASGGPAYRALHSDFRTTAKCVRLLSLLLDQ